MAKSENVGGKKSVKDKVLDTIKDISQFYLIHPHDTSIQVTKWNWQYYRAYSAAIYDFTNRVVVYKDDSGISHLMGNGTILLRNSEQIYKTFRLEGYGAIETVNPDGTSSYSVNLSNGGYTSNGNYVYSGVKNTLPTFPAGIIETRFGGVKLSGSEENNNTYSNTYIYLDGITVYENNISGKDIVPKLCGTPYIPSRRYVCIDEFFTKYLDTDYKFFDDTTTNQFYSDKKLDMQYVILRADKNPPEVESLYLNDVYYLNIPIVHSKTDAEKYLETGELPDDAEIDFTKNGSDIVHIAPEDEKDPAKDSDSDGTKKDKGENVPTPTSIISPRVKGCMLYACSASIIDAFLGWMWNDIDWEQVVINSVTGLYGNFAECVIGIDYVPFQITEHFSTSSTSIVLGRYGTDISASSIGSPLAPAMTVGTVTFPAFRDDFLGYSGYTELKLYLPCVGWIDLDVNLWHGKKCDIYMSFDPVSGHATYLLKREGQLINVYECQFAQKIPFAISTMNEIASSWMDKAKDTAVGLASSLATGGATMIGGAVSAGQSLLSNVGSTPMKIESSVNPTTAYATGYNVIWFAKYPTYNIPTNYGSVVGYPVMETHSLSKLTGYTVIDKPILKQTDGMTKDEYDELISIFKGGFYL